MDFKIFILTFFVLQIFYFQPITAQDDSAAYTAYRTALDGLTDIPAKVEYLTTIGTLLIEENIFDLEKAAAIYRLIGEFLAENPTGITMVERQNLNTLYIKLGEAAVTNNIPILMEMMNVVERPLPATVNDTVRNIITSFANEPNIANKIFENAIDQLYRLQSPLQISEFLRSSEVNNDIIDAFLFNVQMYLYNKFNRYDIDDEYLLYIAHYFYELKTMQIVNLTNAETLDSAIQTLPTTLQSLFFSTVACIRNSNSSEYLYEYTGTALNRSRRYVYTGRSGKRIIRGGIFNTTFSKSMTTIEVTLQNHAYKHYLYRASNDIIYAKISPNRVPKNSLWSLSLNDNKIKFHQDDYYICGSESFKKRNRRIVVAAEYSSLEVPIACEWYVENCQNIN